jgi:hypothetical protein
MCVHYTQMDEIDRNADLSRDGKCRQRSKTAAQAIAEFEASRTLERAGHGAPESARLCRAYYSKWLRSRYRLTFSCWLPVVLSSA